MGAGERMIGAGQRIDAVKDETRWPTPDDDVAVFKAKAAGAVGADLGVALNTLFQSVVQSATLTH